MVGEHVRGVCPRRDRVRDALRFYSGNTEQFGKQATSAKVRRTVEYGASRHVVHGSRKGQRGHETVPAAPAASEHADGVARLAGKAGKLVVRAVDQQNIAGLDSPRRSAARSRRVQSRTGAARARAPLCAARLILGPFREQIYEPARAHRRESLLDSRSCRRSPSRKYLVAQFG